MEKKILQKFKVRHLYFNCFSAEQAVSLYNWGKNVKKPATVADVRLIDPSRISKIKSRRKTEA